MAGRPTIHAADTLPDYGQLYARGPLFAGISPQEAAAMFGCLKAQIRPFAKGERIVRQGDRVRSVGLVLAGRLSMERSDALGNRSILGTAGPGDTFAEAYAASGTPSDVDVAGIEPGGVALIDLERILNTCSSSCAFHARLVRNLFAAMASRNIALTKKIADVSPRTIRGRLLSFLSEQARHADERGVFRIPYTRQQLADYLCVDRSALSHELSKMRGEGILGFEGNAFWFEGGR